MLGLRRLVSEIHRRSLWQVLGIYLGGSWVAYQVVLSLVQGLGLPDWVPPVALILFLIGLPVVLATAFVQEGPQRPNGRARPPPGGSPPQPRRGVAASGPRQHPASRAHHLVPRGAPALHPGRRGL